MPRIMHVHAFMEQPQCSFKNRRPHFRRGGKLHRGTADGDHGQKFVMLIPLTSKRTSAVAVALLRIFTTIGAPSILQSDNGREFSGIANGGKLCGLSRVRS